MKTIYESKEWKSLDPLDRAELLPTIEGVRKGANYIVYAKDGNIDHETIDNLEACLKKTKLHFRMRKRRNAQTIYDICSDKSLLDKLDKEIEGKKSHELRKDIKYHKAMGKVLDYPTCCIEKFLDEIEKGIPSSGRFRREAKKAEDFRFGHALSYVAHIPCDIKCEESIKMGKLIKEALEKYDPEAAKNLRFYKFERIYR